MIEREFLEFLRRGERPPNRIVGRVLSAVENGEPFVQAILKQLSPHLRGAYRIGLTGPPGGGKSTLANRIVRTLADGGQEVGIVAVDPSSPFTGGAILGDRLRMTDIGLHPRVFLRSMAARGATGGMAATAYRVADVLDACGKDWIVFETVGVGQAEIEIAEHADTTIVVLVPESGDGVQAMKAGLMEIADILVVNKADRDQAATLKTELETALELRARDATDWIPPVVMTVAVDGTGMDRLMTEVHRHREFLSATGRLDQRREGRIRLELQKMVEDRVPGTWRQEAMGTAVAELVKKIRAGATSLEEAADALYRRLTGT